MSNGEVECSYRNLIFEIASLLWIEAAAATETIALNDSIDLLAVLALTDERHE